MAMCLAASALVQATENSVGSACETQQPCVSDATCADVEGGGYTCTCNDDHVSYYEGDVLTYCDYLLCYDYSPTACEKYTDDLCQSSASYNCPVTCGLCDGAESPCEKYQPCHEEATCTDVEGGRYTCTCKDGYSGDGLNYRNALGCKFGTCVDFESNSYCEKRKAWSWCNHDNSALREIMADRCSNTCGFCDA